MVDCDGGLTQANPVGDLLPCGQDPSNESTANSLPTASDGVTTSQSQGTLQSQGPSSTAVHLSTTTLDAGTGALIGSLATYSITPGGFGWLVAGPAEAEPADGLLVVNDPRINVQTTTSLFNNNPSISRTRISVGIDGQRSSETAHRNAHSQSMPSFSKVSTDSSMTLEPSSTMDSLMLQTRSGETFFANGASTITPSPAIDSKPSLIFATQSITASFKPQNIIPSIQTPSLGSTSTLDSGTSISVPAVPEFSTKHNLLSDSTASLLPHATASPDLSRSPPALTINAQTVTADSLTQYVIDSQTLTRGGVITVSGTKISLASNASDVVVGTSTEALGPSITAKISSSPNGTEVQTFRGDALGARDGLWGSSMMLLVSFVVLLWL